MKKGISREESVMMQGMAVMLMVFHHLFAFPERIAYAPVMILDFSFLHCETILSYYGRICISLFAFLTGYGMIVREKVGEYASLVSGYRCAVSRLVKFFLRYWLVYLVWVPLGYGLGVYSFGLTPFLKGLFGLDCSYNQEWWYVAEYAKLLLCFPVVVWLFRKSGRMKLGVMAVMGAAAAIGIAQNNTFAHVFSYALSGMAIAEYGVFERLNERLYSCGSWIRLICMLLGLGILFSRMLVASGVKQDALFAPVWIWTWMTLLNMSVATWPLKYLLGLVGRYSTYIYLTHTFFAYYYFQRICFLPRYSWLVFVFCIASSMISGFVLEPIALQIEKRWGNDDGRQN